MPNKKAKERKQERRKKNEHLQRYGRNNGFHGSDKKRRSLPSSRRALRES